MSRHGCTTEGPLEGDRTVVGKAPQEEKIVTCMSDKPRKENTEQVSWARGE